MGWSIVLTALSLTTAYVCLSLALAELGAYPIPLQCLHLFILSPVPALIAPIRVLDLLEAE